MTNASVQRAGIGTVVSNQSGKLPLVHAISKVSGSLASILQQVPGPSRDVCLSGTQREKRPDGIDKGEQRWHHAGPTGQVH
jgi:hypothetical protein